MKRSCLFIKLKQPENISLLSLIWKKVKARFKVFRKLDYVKTAIFESQLL
jgi:hypothetical protein